MEREEAANKQVPIALRSWCVLDFLGWRATMSLRAYSRSLRKDIPETLRSYTWLSTLFDANIEDAKMLTMAKDVFN